MLGVLVWAGVGPVPQVITTVDNTAGNAERMP
jgi:hypothetical protein